MTKNEQFLTDGTVKWRVHDRRRGHGTWDIQRNTAYAAGDILTSPDLPPGCIIVVTTAGTTAETEPDWDNIISNMGGVVTDGSVTFYINDTLNKHSVGDIVYKPVSKVGEHEYLLPLDGQTLDATTYKRLTDYLGTTTLPDLNGRYLRADTTPGTMVEAGLPNINGTFNVTPSTLSLSNWTQCTGMFTRKVVQKGTDDGLYDGGSWKSNSGFGTLQYVLDASSVNSIYGNSDTVTPLTYTVRAYISYA